jgi:conjugative relaxase-like TrwC/TraI family protein
MMGAASIGSSKAGGYARYLESKTITPELGDYYLNQSGEPVQAPGRWLASAETLARLGIEGETVQGREFVSLMEGKHPRTGEWLRPAGAGGGRGGGIDLTFSSPKSVSITWALGDSAQRDQIEAAHRAAVDRALAHLRQSVPAVRRKQAGEIIHEPPADLIAAEYRHTTARGILDGDVPDPQLHSHVVITSVVREDGRIVAVASRPIFRAARELGAFYRSALAQELAERGYRIDAGTGKNGRYFEIAGIPRSMIDAFSTRTREVIKAAERFRAKHGRALDPGELRALKLEHRRQKILVTRGDLQQAWANLRAGRPERAMAHYRAQGRLHMADTRDQAVEQAVADWAKLTETLPVEQVALISDASNKEIDRMNARAQHHRAQRGELGESEIEIPGTHYAVRQGDRVALIDQHHEPGRQRFENGERGQILNVNQAGEVSVQFEITGRRATIAGEDLANLRLAYASHIHRAQGATVDRTVVVCGGWQTSKEPAYVEASRARHGTDWYLSRQDLGEEGHDTDRIDRLAEAMKTSRAQTPSLAHAEHPHRHPQRPTPDLHIDPTAGERRQRLRLDRERAIDCLDAYMPPSRAPVDPHAHLAIPPSRRPLPGLARAIRRLATPNREISRSR